MLVNGKKCDLISIRDRGLLFGDGVFRTMLASQGRVQHWPLHYQKLQHDCSALGISCPDFGLLSVELDELLIKLVEGVVKLIITRGSGTRGYSPQNSNEPTRIWGVSAFPAYPSDCATSGVKVRWCQLRLSNQPRLAGIKHLNRLENVLAAAEWSDADIAEGLLLDESGNVIEGTRSNLFMVFKGSLITPDLSNCGVAGVQRDRVIAWAAKHSIPIEVRNITQAEVLNADEIFLVNSVIGLWPVRELEQRRWMTFPIAINLLKYFKSDF